MRAKSSEFDKTLVNLEVQNEVQYLNEKSTNKSWFKHKKQLDPQYYADLNITLSNETSNTFRVIL